MQEIKSKAVIEAEIQKSGFSSLFSSLPGALVSIQTFAQRQYIVKEGKLPTHLFYLTSGRAKLYTTLANGKVALIDFFIAPCFIGEMELVGQKQDICSVQAVQPCRCLALPLAACQTALLADPVFLRAICGYLSDKNAKNIRTLTQNQAYPLQQRLAHFILLSAAIDGYQEKHSHAAGYLGVSYRHYLYVLAQFVANGLLKKEKPGYHILNQAALLRLARKVEPDFQLF